QADGEAAALAHGAGRLDGAAHGADEAVDDVEPQPEPLLPGAARGGLGEGLEDAGEELRLDPVAVVDDGDVHPPVAGADLELDGCSRAGVLERVSRQVRQHLYEPGLVAERRRNV